MFTTHFGNLAAIRPPAVAISISRGKPRNKGGWRARLPAGVASRDYDQLAPTWTALKGSAEDYDRAFAAILAGLDPAAVFAELGENAVLLCFCEPNAFCHRRIVAEWLEASLDIVIPELGLDRDETYVIAGPAYPFWIPPPQKLEWIERKLGLAPSRPPGSTGRQTWNAKTRRWEAAK